MRTMSVTGGEGFIGSHLVRSFVACGKLVRMPDNFSTGTALRFFNVYGPRQSPNSDYAGVMPKFIQQWLTGVTLTKFVDVNHMRDFVFENEVVRACQLAAETPQADGLAINICSGQTVSIMELAETLSVILTSETLTQFAPARAGDIAISMGDTTRAAQVLGFTSEVSLAQEHDQTVGWMQT